VVFVGLGGVWGGAHVGPILNGNLNGRPRDLQKCVKNALWSPFQTAFSDYPPDHSRICAKIRLRAPPNPQKCPLRGQE
jgi:hypothetical protein